MLFSRIIAFTGVFFCACMLSFQPCYSQPAKSLELINNAKQLDGKTVTYQGEAIGEMMVRGDYAWMHLNDGTIAVSIWLKKEDLPVIEYLGNHQAHGDIIEVTGLLHRNCPEHGGDLDIHAAGINKIARGGRLPEDRGNGKMKIALILTIAVLFAFFMPTVSSFLRRRA